jgi:chromosome segregation ATPase
VQQEAEQARLNSELENKQQEISQLTKSIDAIVSDLASIKESKRGFFAKPITDFVKINRRNEGGGC